MIRRLLPFWKSARNETLAGLTIATLAVGLELMQPWPIKWLVDHVLGSRPPSHLVATLLHAFGSGNVAGSVFSCCVTIVLLALGHKAAHGLSNLLLIRAGGKLVFELRCTAFDQLNRLSLGYHDRTKVGESLYRVAYDAHAAQSLLSGAVFPAMTGILLFTGILVVMVRLDLVMTLVTLATAPAFVALIIGFRKRIDRSSQEYHQQESALVAAAQESLSSMRAIQAFTMEARTGVRFRHQARHSLTQNLRLISSQLQFSGGVGVVMAIGTAVVAGIGAMRVQSGHLSIGDILVFLAYLGMLYQPVNAFCQSTSVVQTAGAQLRRVFEVIDSVPMVRDLPQARVLDPVRGQIEFRQVSFSYETGSPVLEDIDLVLKPGTSVALVGRSGAGKTTLASLLIRFYDPSGGAVLLDGVNLRDLKLDWLRRQVSVVMQDPILFSGSIRKNIAVGHPDATLAEVIIAAKRAQLHDDIEKMPQGYATLIGERGVKLSGGQRQRLSIARALIKNAPILILDEPTSALDPQTEANLLAALKELMRGRTTLIIAHRLTTAQATDQIVVLHEGRISEQGTHEELLQARGRYASMLQNSHSGLIEPQYASPSVREIRSL